MEKTGTAPALADMVGDLFFWSFCCLRLWKRDKKVGQRGGSGDAGLRSLGGFVGMAVPVATGFHFKAAPYPSFLEFFILFYFSSLVCRFLNEGQRFFAV